MMPSLSLSPLNTSSNSLSVVLPPYTLNDSHSDKQNNVKDVHILILVTCRYVTSYGERDFAHVTEVKDLDMGRVSWVMRVGLI